MLCLLSISPVWAQSGGSQSGFPAAPESLQVASPRQGLLRELGLKPTYRTQVQVNRTAFDWGQNFGVDRTIQRLQLKNTWDVRIAKNSAQNHYKSRSGNATAHGEYSFPGLGGWSTGADLGLKRVFTRGDFNRTVANGNEFSWFVTAGAPGGVLSRLFHLPEGALSWDVTGSTGTTEQIDVRENQAQTGASGRSDSTYATGGTAALDSRLSAAAGTKWKLDVTGHLDRDNRDSRTRQRAKSATQDTDTTLVADDANNRKRLGFSSAWTPTVQNRIGVTGSFLRSVNQSYSANVGAQDTKTGLEQRLGIDAKLVPFWGINMDLKAEDSRADVAYELSTQGRATRKRSGSGRLNFIVGSSVPILRGLESTTDATFDRSRVEFQSSTAARDTDYDTEATNLRQVLRRPLGTRLVAVTTAEANLTRMLYDNKGQDRDDLRLLLDGALGYRPATGIDCRLTGQWRKQQTVYIPAASSRNSVTGKSYAVGAEAGLQLTPLVKISQKYQMTADYSFYDFNENSNTLSRTTEVRTGLQSTLGGMAKLNLDHSFRFKDSGKYVRSTPGAPRLFAKAADETYQFITVATAYDFRPGVTLRASERMESRVQQPRGDPKPPATRTTKMEFTGGLDLRHQFSPDFSVEAKVERTESTTEKSYWRVSGSLSRVFGGETE